MSQMYQSTTETKGVAVIGLGFVGSSLERSFREKGVSPLFVYDKYKNGGIGTLQNCLDSSIMFLCLPTLYLDAIKSYNKSSIFETCELLSRHEYTGTVVLKSTVEPGTTEILSRKYSNLSLIHNPEFLTAATAYEDFHNQKHVVIGKAHSTSEEHLKKVASFYSKHYPHAEISLSTCTESEAMKSFVNTFYSVKIQFFNELYLLCKQQSINYDTVRQLMLKNSWINPMHTIVPGPDGMLSYGGHCFPKDTNALSQYMRRCGTPNAVLKACIEERNCMRNELCTEKTID